MKQVRLRFWIEAGLASLTAAMCLVTAVWPDWIEEVFRVDPDRHSGALEWGIVAVLLALTVAVGRSAYVEWRRPAPAT
jgi:hypothetical protein